MFYELSMQIHCLKILKKEKNILKNWIFSQLCVYACIELVSCPVALYSRAQMKWAETLSAPGDLPVFHSFMSSIKREFLHNL